MAVRSTKRDGKTQSARRPARSVEDDSAPAASFTHDEIVQGVAARRVKALVDSGDLPLVIVNHVVPARTFSRRLARNETLRSEEADAIGRFLRIKNLARETFDTPARADRWLNAPIAALGGRKPIDLAQTDPGARQVEAALTRFAYGDYT